ncbi:type II toxin-antitoxin system VapB family antitoxin [soil metagenome]
MALNIKNAEVERLAAEVAEIAGESKTEAVRKALTERKDRLLIRSGEPDRRAAVLDFLERQVWPRLPESSRGRMPGRDEEEEILGDGPDGV